MEILAEITFIPSVMFPRSSFVVLDLFVPHVFLVLTADRICDVRQTIGEQTTIYPCVHVPDLPPYDLEEYGGTSTAEVLHCRVKMS